MCKAHTEAHGHLQSVLASQVGRRMDCATVRIGIPVRYTSTFVVEESPEMQAWRITCQRLSASSAFPTPAPLPVPCQFLRSAANKAAAVLTKSRGPQSCIMKTMVRPDCAVDMGADRLLYGLDVNGERRCRYGVDEKGVVGVATRPLDRIGFWAVMVPPVAGCRVPGRGSFTVCRARCDDQPVLIEAETTTTQVHCQHAGTSGESVLLRWRRAKMAWGVWVT